MIKRWSLRGNLRNHSRPTRRVHTRMILILKLLSHDAFGLPLWYTRELHYGKTAWTLGIRVSFSWPVQENSTEILYVTCRYTQKSTLRFITLEL